MPRRYTGMTVALCALVALLLASAQAQDEQNDSFGGFEVGEHQAVGEGLDHGRLAIEVETPEEADEAAVDVTVVGPDGIRLTGAVEAQQTIDGLPPGEYAVMGTDQDLEIVAGLTEVRADTTTEVSLVMETYLYEEDFAFDYDAYDPYGGYEVGYDPIAGYDPGAYGGVFEEFGRLDVSVGLEDDGEASEVKVSVIGPDDADYALFGEAFVDRAPAGVYSVAATASGYQMQQALVWVRPGERASVTLPLVALGAPPEVGAAEGETEAGLLDAFDYDGDAVTVAGYRTGLFELLAGDDEVLTETEFLDGFELLHGEHDYEFAVLDEDGDGEVTEQEFLDTYDGQYFDTWDANGNDRLDADELGAGFFQIIDVDGDGDVAPDEYEPYADWLGIDYEAMAGDDTLDEESFVDWF